MISPPFISSQTRGGDSGSDFGSYYEYNAYGNSALSPGELTELLAVDVTKFDGDGMLPGNSGRDN